MSVFRRDFNDPIGVDVSEIVSFCLTAFQITLALYTNVFDGRGVRKKVSLCDLLDKLNRLYEDIGLLYLMILNISMAQW